MPATTIEAVMQMRRGLENDLDISQLRIGEWALSTDRKWVRICYAEGKVIKIASQEAMDETLAEIQEIEDAILVMKNAAAASALAASGSATAADGSAEDAEAWAVGKRDGVDVPSTDPAYNNNAKYWAQHAVQSLNNLTDTDISNPSNNDVLKYNSTSGKWENGVGGGSGGHTIKDGAGTSMTQRAALQFAGGLKVSDDSTNDLTKIQKDIPITWQAWNQLTAQEAEGNDYYITDEPFADGQVSADVFTKLWENPSPTADFAAQTITLVSDDYDFLMVVFRTGAANFNDVNIASKGNPIQLSSSGSTGTIYRLMNYVSATSYSVGAGYYAGAESNASNVPLVIYGIKKTIDLDLTMLVANVSTDASKCMIDANTSVAAAINDIRGTQWVVVNASLKYRIIDGIVFVQVTTDTNSTWNSIGFIPSSVAPTTSVYQSLYSDPSNNFASVTVETTGNVLCFSSVSISGTISYPLG